LGRPSGSATRARPFDDPARLAIRFWNRSPTHCPRSLRFNSNQLGVSPKKTARSVRNPTGAAPLTPPARHHPAPIGATPHPSGGRSQGVDKADLQGWGWVREAQVPGLTLAIWSNAGEAKQPTFMWPAGERGAR